MKVELRTFGTQQSKVILLAANDGSRAGGRRDWPFWHKVFIWWMLEKKRFCVSIQFFARSSKDEPVVNEQQFDHKWEVEEFLRLYTPPTKNRTDKDWEEVDSFFQMQLFGPGNNLLSEFATVHSNLPKLFS